MNGRKQGYIGTLLLSKFLLVTIITVLGIASLPFVKIDISQYHAR
tara:strand:- start:306 stop:440 length:135 start_codon:yes stop_codon:yes gene_type:complete